MPLVHGRRLAWPLRKGFGEGAVAKNPILAREPRILREDSSYFREERELHVDIFCTRLMVRIDSYQFPPSLYLNPGIKVKLISK